MVLNPTAYTGLERFLPLRQERPAPIRMEFEGQSFLDNPAYHDMEFASYLLTLQSVKKNLEVYMHKHFGAESEYGSPLADAPLMLINYFEGEILVRGYKELPEILKTYILSSVLAVWGFEHKHGKFILPRREALVRMLKNAGGNIPDNLVQLTREGTTG